MKDLLTHVLITQAVADECLGCSSSDAVLIRQAIDAGWIDQLRAVGYRISADVVEQLKQG